jgi:hypothetical protein
MNRQLLHVSPLEPGYEHHTAKRYEYAHGERCALSPRASNMMDGNEQPFQASRLEANAGTGSVASARISFFAELKKNSE